MKFENESHVHIRPVCLFFFQFQKQEGVRAHLSIYKCEAPYEKNTFKWQWENLGIFCAWIFPETWGIESFCASVVFVWVFFFKKNPSCKGQSLLLCCNLPE